MFLDKYIDEHGKLTDYKVFTDGVSGIINIAVNDLFLAQFKDGDFNGMDIIVKLLAIENYYGENDFGFKLYNKMQMLRVRECWEGRYKKLIENVERNGIVYNNYIETDINYSIHDGAHRLALALYHGIENLNIKVFNTDRYRRDYGIEWFIQNGFTTEEISIIMNKFKEVVNKINLPYYCVFWPPARNIFDKLESELIQCEEGISVTNKETLLLPKPVFTKFMYDIYNTDDIAKFKLDLKYKYLMNSLAVDGYDSSLLPLIILETRLDIPDFRMKGLTGLPQSKKTMRIKKQLRTNNSELITNYYYDIIMHMTDNTIQNKDVQKILSRLKQ